MNLPSVAPRALGFAIAVAMLAFVLPATAEIAAAPWVPVTIMGLSVMSALHSVAGRSDWGLFGGTAAVALALTVADPAAGSSRVAVAVASAAVPLVSPLLSAVLSGRRSWVWVGIGAGLVAGPLQVLVYDPFLDPACRLNCDHNPVALAHVPLLAAIAGAAVWIVAVAIVAGLRHGRHRLAGLAPAIASLLVAGGYGFGLPFAAVVVAGVMAADLWGRVRTELRLRDLVRTLQSGDDLEQALRRIMGDPQLSVAYVVDGEPTLVDRIGEPCGPPEPGRVSTPVATSTGTVAWIRHRSDAIDAARLGKALNGEARLAFDVGRLRALSAVHARDITDSRARIITAGDAERRRVERDLHDGAQQFVLAVGMQVELALLDAEPESTTHATLEVCMSRARAALDDLRAITRTLRPYPVDLAGLDSTLQALARRCAWPSTVDTPPERSFGAIVEAACLAFVEAAFDAATSAVHLTVTDLGASLQVRLRGRFNDEGLEVGIDRVAAMGGSTAFDSTGVTAVLPCE